MLASLLASFRTSGGHCDLTDMHLLPTSPSHLHIYRASEYLPKHLVGSKGASFSVYETALQDALGINVPLWDWLETKVPIDQVQSEGPGYPSVPDTSNCNLEPDEEGLVHRPELSNFSLAMAGGGNASGAAHAYGE